MRKKIVVITLCCCILLTIIAPSSNAVSNVQLFSTDSRSILIGSVISPLLQQRMTTLGDNDLIPVTIELCDTIDLQSVEQTAIARADISLDHLSKVQSYSSYSSEASSLTESALAVYDKIYIERIAILENHYQSLITNFMDAVDFESISFHSIGKYTPFIRGALLTSEQISNLASNSNVRYIDYTDFGQMYDFGTSDATQYSSIEDTIAIIGGDVAISHGYTGNGINVGVVESYHPDKTQMGEDSDDIVLVNGISTASHATMTTGIIKQLAPDCTIYTYSTVDAASKDGDSHSYPHGGNVIDGCETLIANQKVHVINISYGAQYTENISAYTREINALVNNTKVPIVVAAGNTNTCPTYMNCLGLAPNVITVGAVTITGTDPTSADAYSFASYSQFNEPDEFVNKPDICAPGNVSIYIYTNSGTSFSAPHVTGTIVQMMCRNSSMIGKPEAIKAAIMASATYNGGTDMTYMSWLPASDQEGAGVINAEICFNIASSGYHYTISASTSGTYSYSVYCSDTTIPLRVAVAWATDTVDGAIAITDFDLRIYKDGVLVASSMGRSNSTVYPNSNYEIVHLSPTLLQEYGTGTYMVKVNCGVFNGPSPCRVGIGWDPIQS